MGRRFINQLKENESVIEIYQLTDRFLRPNKNGNLYMQMIVSDRTASMDARYWNATEEMLNRFEIGDFVVFEGSVQRFAGSLQFIVKKMTKANPAKINLPDFSRGRQVDIPGLIRRMKEILRSLSNSDLLNLADCFMADEIFLTKFSAVPAGVKLHHAYAGGLLEHTVHMMELALHLAQVYGTTLDRDLLVCATFLHDVGKIEELAVNGGFSYTDTGQILGHPMLGIEILQRKIEETERLTGQPFPTETAMLLKHMILSHHGTLENGCSRVPMTLEALALHYIDSLDAKLAEFQKDIHEDPNTGSAWTNYIPAIERKLYKKKPEG